MVRQKQQAGASASAQAVANADEAYAVAATVADPELPFITIEELGILRSVSIDGDTVVAKLAPTYLGCPAVKVIEQSVLDALQSAGYTARVESQLTPPWTTEWISDAGREKLESHGIVMEKALPKTAVVELFAPQAAVLCPHCAGGDTKIVSRFGSTPCKSQYQCNTCAEPFELFKCH